MTQTLLSADHIRKVRDLAWEDVSVPEWPNEDGTPGLVRIQEMSASDSLRMHDLVQASPEDGIYLMLVFSSVDANFQHLFDTSSDESIKAEIEGLRGKNIHAMNRLQGIALKLNRRKVDNPNASGEAASVASPTSSLVN